MDESMNQKKNLFDKVILNSGIINLIVGFSFVISLLLIYLNPYNRFAIMTAASSAGLMNIMNGFKLVKDPKRKTTGSSYILMGVILIAFGFFLIQYVI